MQCYRGIREWIPRCFSTLIGYRRGNSLWSFNNVKNSSLPTGLYQFIWECTAVKHMDVNYVKKQFSTNGNLSVHLRMHSGDTYGCKLCEKQFTTNANLSVHMRTRTNEKLFRCTQCSKKFSQSAHLTAHIRTHNSEWSYRCEQ